MLFFRNLLGLTACLLAWEAPAQYTVREPRAIPLHGEWLFALDPAETGETGRWFRSDMPLQRWDKVTVPHCFSADNRFLNYTGTAWYRRTFGWQPTPGNRVILTFDASYYQTTVYLNNQKIGTHAGGYTPFRFDVTEALTNGQNILAVSVNNNTWKPGTIPGAKDDGQPNDPFTGWLNYGGLIRPVYLTVEPAVYVDNLKVEALPDLTTGTATITVKTRIRNTTGQAVTPQLSFLIQQNKQFVPAQWVTKSGSVAAGQTGVLEATTTLKPALVKLWQLDSPALYSLRVVAGTDTATTHFGIRKVEVRNAQLLLNGQSIRVAGGNRVIDYPGLGSMEPDWLVEKDLRGMKEAGMEFQRLTHYTPSETVYDWADRHGMLLISEAGNWQLTPRQMADDTIRARFRQQFREMAERDWNHPSIIAYSVGNEYQSQTPEGQNWTRDMIAYARQLDPTRLCTFATLRLNSLPVTATDEASQYVDFVSTNTYGNPAKVLDRIHELYPDKPILISEYGQRADTPAGETGPVDYLAKYMVEIRKRPYVVGASWWTYNDYQSRYTGTNPSGYRPWGLVNPDRSERPLYPVHQREMAPLMVEKLSYIFGHEGVHQLRLRVTARADFPAYTLLGYQLTAGPETRLLPTLQPGQSVELTVPVRGFGQTLPLTILKPTGFTVLSQLMNLTDATR